MANSSQNDSSNEASKQKEQKKTFIMIVCASCVVITALKSIKFIAIMIEIFVQQQQNKRRT